MATQQKTLFDVDTPAPTSDRSGTFIDNMQLPVHRWFRYSAGFSAAWARSLIEERKEAGAANIFDPFVGSGTVVLEAMAAGTDAIGIESHPFVQRLAKAKLNWPVNPVDLREHAGRMLDSARSTRGSHAPYASLVTKCFPPETLERLDSIRAAWLDLDDGSNVSELCWLAMVAILRSTSPVGTAPWQYVLPRKSKSQPLEPYNAFERQVEMMVSDIGNWRRFSAGGSGTILGDDAREMESVPEQWADLVVTSPPYANNYDYADATRLEQSFLGEISGWSDLQTATRPHLVRSCTQHVAPNVRETDAILHSECLESIRSEIQRTCAKLAEERQTRGGKKPYHTMIACYFHDLSLTWINLRRVVRAGGEVCFVIGDSAPYGIHVPVERWLGELAVAAGFKEYAFEKLRDRNTKWKNRKHRVKLHEGRLWVKG